MNEKLALLKINIFLTQLNNNRRNCSRNGLTLGDQDFDWEHNYMDYLVPTTFRHKGLDVDGDVLAIPIPSYEYADGKWINYPGTFGFPDMRPNLLSAIFEHINWKCAFKVDESAETIELKISLYFTPKVGYRKINTTEPMTTVTYNYSAETDSWTQYDLYESGQHLDVFDPFKAYVPPISTEKIDSLSALFNNQ